MVTISKAKALAEYYSENGWRTQPYTITYIEDADADTWKSKPNQPDYFNDVRILWVPAEEKVIMSSQATTEPGLKAVNNPINENGTFRIQLDTVFKQCWEIGRHITKYSNQSALVQVDEVSGYRDKDRNNIRSGDNLFTGLFGINQHTCGNSADSSVPDNVSSWSYGCLVGRYPSTHYNIFMPACRDSGQKRFDTVVLDGSKFNKWLTAKNYSLV